MTELITPPGAPVAKPARTTAGSSLVAGMRVEVTVVARRPGGTPSADVAAGR
jgi:enamine deaminase RidA (YjgF/YER057c/UK114 family)